MSALTFPEEAARRLAEMDAIIEELFPAAERLRKLTSHAKQRQYQHPDDVVNDTRRRAEEEA